MKKLTNTVKDALVKVADALAKGITETVDVSQETLEAFCEHGLIDYTPCGSSGNWWLTEKGNGIVNERRREQEKAREKRTAASKARHRTMSSLGMRRTSAGSYE